MPLFENPKKSLGQNFLIDKNYQLKIIRELKITSECLVVEIGPGRGALTQHLLKLGVPLLLIEKDKRLFNFWQEELRSLPQHQIFCSDALEFAWCNKIIAPALLVSNLPYNVGTAILSRILSQRLPFESLLVMLQREVAQRLLASCGQKEYGLLSVATQVYADAKKLFDVPPTAFKPQPKVYSTVLELKPKINVRLDAEYFCLFVKQLFMWRRKTLAHILKNMFHIDLNVNRYIRAENLSIDELWQLFDQVQAKRPSHV